jgi:Tfp pilus assembly protein PilO
MSDFLIIYATLGMLIMILALYFGYTKKNKQEQKELELIEQEIDEKREQLQNLAYDNTVNLTKLEIEVLEYYDICNIRIPSDIIEDLHNMKLTDEKDIFSFIESQRNYWKLENTKKVFRKGVK